MPHRWTVLTGKRRICVRCHALAREVAPHIHHVEFPYTLKCEGPTRPYTGDKVLEVNA